MSYLSHQRRRSHIIEVDYSSLMCKYAISDYRRDNILKYFLVIIMSHDEPPGQPKDLVHVLTDLAEFKKKTEQEKDKIVHGVLVLGDHLVHHLLLPYAFYSILY